MSWFKKKVPIKIIKTESLSKQDEEPKSVRGTKPADKPKSRKEEVPSPNIKIDIVGKQQLKQSLTADDWREAAQQVQQEISRMTLPEIILQAREAREHGKLDEAVLMLRRQQREFSSTPEIEDEFKMCMQNLENLTLFQKISNAQLAAMLFDSARFAVGEHKALGNYLESRIALTCENPDLNMMLQGLAISQKEYYCYSLAEFARPLDVPALGEVQADLMKQAKSLNRTIHFVICQESQTNANWVISDTRVSQSFTTIPLERGEIRQAIINDTAVIYLEKKINAWQGNFSLFANASPVAGQGEFFGRDTFFHEITSRISKGQSFYVLGNRRMGKTSLIRHLQSTGAFNKYLFGFIDLQVYVGDDNFDGVINHLINQWLLNLQKRDRKMEQEISEHLAGSMPPVERFKKFMECLHDAGQRNQVEITCLAIFDDANLFFHFEDTDSDLWRHGARDFIRMLHKHHDRIITGITVWDFETWHAIDRDLGYFSEKGTVIPLGPLTEDECTTMIVRTGGIILMRFDRSSTEAIYRETGGHPYWTRLLCDSISRKNAPRYETLQVTQAMVDKAAREFVSVHPDFLNQVLDLLKHSELKVIEFLGRSSGPVHEDELGRTLGLSERDLRDALTHLDNYGWVRLMSPSSSEYILRMHLLNRYYQIQ